MMKIVADEDIPFVQDYFSHAGQLLLIPGRQINASHVNDADLLLVRSVTKVDKALLAHSSVKWVGSLTAGADHLDLSWLAQAGIEVSLAHGFNAQPVADYVVSVIAALQLQGRLAKKNLRAGIVGFGATGQSVANACRLLGIETVHCDPIRAINEKNFHSTCLSQFNDLDLISLHVPLTTHGEHATYHLIDAEFIKRQRRQSVFINASRGSVINPEDVLEFGEHLQWCFDVWENEPNIDRKLLALTTIATPHMAGYSIESKPRGINLLYQSAMQAGWLKTRTASFANTLPLELKNAAEATWQEIVLSVFDPLTTTDRLKAGVAGGAMFFDKLRLAFNQRHELSNVVLSEEVRVGEDKKILQELGMKMPARE